MRVLITGANRGIGRATALRLAGKHDVAVGYNESPDAAEEVAEAAHERGATATAVQGESATPGRPRGWSTRRSRVWAGWTPS